MNLRILTWVALFCTYILSATITQKSFAEEKKDVPKAQEGRGLPKPKWEVGLAMASFYMPDYPGADESTGRYLFLPFVIYRGEVIRNDRGGLKGLFLNNDRWEISFSAGAAFPVRSSENKRRKDMPNLDWMGQIGPQIVYHFNKNPVAQFDLLVPYRFVFSTDFKSTDSHGTVFNPEIRVSHWSRRFPKTFYSITVGPIWGSDDLMDYFYEVPSRYETAQRPAYDAQSGYMGLDSTISVSHIFRKDIMMYAGMNRRFFSAAKNRSSPLLQDIETESYFVGLAWSFYQSGIGFENRPVQMSDTQ